MDKSEPTLVPEWLKGGGSASHLSASALSHSDNHPLSKHAQNKSSLNGSDRDAHHLSVLERTTSAYVRRSSTSNDSAYLRANSNFGRSQHDRDWDDISDYHDKDKLVSGDNRHTEHSDPQGNILPSKFDKEKLQRSQSMIVGKQDDTWSKKVAGNLTNANKNRHSNSNGNGVPARVGIGIIHGTAFEQDFPFLGTEEKQGNIGRASSPGLSTGVVYSESWKSALTEVQVGMGRSTTGVASVQQPVPANSATPLPNISTGLNMAEALAQGPPRARTPPQSTAGIQRFEELAIRQAKLIPMTPSTPKALVSSPSDKSKPKIGLQQNSIHFVNHTRAPARPDSIKISGEGRLQVLKPSQDFNGISAAAKDSLSPTNGSKLLNSPLGSSPLAAAGSAPFRSLGNSPKNVTAERYPSVFRSTTEKKSTFQVQSRNDFFNHLKKKSSSMSTSVGSDPGPSLPSTSEKSGESVAQVTAASDTEHGGDSSSSDFSSGNKIGNIVYNGDAYDGPCHFGNGDKDSICDVIPNPDEEEASFLRSLGWDENGGEDEGLTAEEIRAFCEKYKAKMPSSKVLHGIQSKTVLDSCNSSCGVASSFQSSSDSEPDS